METVSIQRAYLEVKDLLISIIKFFKENADKIDPLKYTIKKEFIPNILETVKKIKIRSKILNSINIVCDQQ